MNKKAALTMSLAEVGSIVLFCVVVLILAPKLGGKLYAVVKNEDQPQKQLDNLIDYINADIDNIQKSESGQIYPIDLDGSKYVISVDSCEVEKGKCKGKTKLCLKRDIDAKDFCSKKTLDYPISNPYINLDTKNFLINWSNNQLSISSYP